MPEGVLKGAGRIIGHGDTDAALPFLMHVVGAEKEIVFSVLPDHGRRPQGPPEPGNAVLRQHLVMLGPMHQVLRRKSVHEQLLLVGVRIRGIDPVFLVENHGLRVRIPAVEERIAARMGDLVGGAAPGDVLPQGFPVPADLEGMVAAVLEIGFPGVAGALETVHQQKLGLRIQRDGQGIEQHRRGGVRAPVHGIDSNRVAAAHEAGVLG